MTLFSRGCLLFGLMLFSVQSPAAEVKPLEIGIFPYASARIVLTSRQPVRLYLEKALERPVQLSTAPDYKSFVERTQRGDYDVVITAPHFARLAQTEAGYVPLVGYTRELRGLVVVARNSSLHDLGELRGKPVAIPDRIAIVSMMGLQLLRDRGLQPDIDVPLRPMLSHNNAVLSIQRGESAAAITEWTALKQMPDDLQNSVRILASTSRVPHVMYLGHPRLQQKYLEKIKSALLRFGDEPEGKAYLEAAGREAIRPIADADLRAMDPYVRELKQLLESPR